MSFSTNPRRNIGGDRGQSEALAMTGFTQSLVEHEGLEMEVNSADGSSLEARYTEPERSSISQ